MSISAFIRRLWSRGRGKVQRAILGRKTGVDYWRVRARLFGPRSVVDVRHDPAEYGELNEAQKALLFPLLRAQLRGDEATILDFGCGPGRFTPGLAELIGGTAIGVDPVEQLLQFAPEATNVTYRTMQPPLIPLPDESVDAVWICLVLGGITDDVALRRTAYELARVVRQDGVVFLVENVSVCQDATYWAYRDEGFYCRLVPGALLRVLAHYDDMGDIIAVMAGRSGPTPEIRH